MKPLKKHIITKAMNNNKSQFFVCGEIVELSPEMKEEHKGKKVACSFRKGKIINIKNNEVSQFPRIITVDHGNNKIFAYMENWLIKSKEIVEISYYGNDQPHINNEGDNSVHVHFPTNMLTIEIGGCKHKMLFNHDGSISFLDNSGKEYIKVSL